MKDHLLSLWHQIVPVLPGTPTQWAGAAVLLVLSFILPRTQKTRANSLIEAVINSLLATPGIGALLKAVPVLNAVLIFLSTPTTTTTTITTVTTEEVKPPVEPPAIPPEAPKP